MKNRAASSMRSSRSLSHQHTNRAQTHTRASPHTTQTRAIHNPRKVRAKKAQAAAFQNTRDRLLAGTWKPRPGFERRFQKRTFCPTNMRKTPIFNRDNSVKQETPQLQAWVYNLQARPVAMTELSPKVWNADVSRTDIIHQIVRWQMAGRRAGTHKSLNRREISGTGKKPFAQKGGGRARASTLVSPIHIGGARAHPRKIRDYSYELNSKYRRQALSIALTSLYQNNKLSIIDSISVPTHNTNEVNNILSSWQKHKALIIHGNYEEDPNLQLALRNNPKYNILPARGANVKDLLSYPAVLMTLQAKNDLEQRMTTINPVKLPVFLGTPVPLRSLHSIRKQQHQDAIAAAVLATDAPVAEAVAQ